MSPKLDCHQNWNVTKTEMSPKRMFHQKLIVTKARLFDLVLRSFLIGVVNGQELVCDLWGDQGGGGFSYKDSQIPPPPIKLASL